MEDQVPPWDVSSAEKGSGSHKEIAPEARKGSTEVLIMAAQDQALSTRSIEAWVSHSRRDPKCRLCKDAPETTQHIVAGYEM